MTTSVPARMLFAGSRSLTWDHLDVVRESLLDAYGQLVDRVGPAVVAWDRPPVLVHGACPPRRKAPGGDVIADRLAREVLSWPVECHPADWTGPCRAECRHGPRRRDTAGVLYCPAAGVYRTAAMIATGPDVCLVVIRQGSAGASYCAAAAREAGIPTIRRVVA